MNDYINKDYYKQLSAADRHFINLSYAAASELIDRLNAENIPFSAAVGDFKNVITVSKSNAERVKQLTDEIAENAKKRRRIIGNTEYRYIPDKKYIDTDPETAEQLANLLAGDNNRKFSGIIDGNKATITVSGEKNAADIRRMIENIKNSDLISEMRRSGFERIADSDGFINIRSSNTGEVCGFADLATVRNMFVDPDNEFFHPVETAYRIDLTTDAFADAYYISEYNTSDGTEKDMYFDKDGNIPTFTTIDEALAYIADNNIAVTNTAEQLNSWRNDDADRENEAISEANNQLIQQFPKRGEAYPDDITYNPDSGNYTWIFFNPDGNNGQGEFAEKTITPQDIYEAYAERTAAGSEEAGRNAFIEKLFSVCGENTIDTYSGYFADYANDYISKPDNAERFFGIAPNGNAQDIDTFIEKLESSCPAVEEEKLRREKADEPIGQDSDNIEINGYSGTWYVIDSRKIGEKELFLLESEVYGDEAANLITDDNRNVIMDNVHNGFEDYIAAAVIPEDQMQISGETASEMWYYGFDIYVNGEKLAPFNDTADKSGTFGRLEDENSIISAVTDNVGLYHAADEIANNVFDLSSRYYNAPHEVGTPYFLNLERYHEDYDWENWRSDENEYANTMFALLEGNYAPINDFFETVLESGSYEQKSTAEAALSAVDEFRQEHNIHAPENSPVGNNIPLSEQLISITEEISRKQNEFTGYISTGNYESAGTAAAELAELSQQADRIKNEIRQESIKREDVDTLRSIKPERKSVQNMLENEVAQTPKFEKLLNDEMGEKSAYEMRNGNLDWRNDSSKYAPIINVENRTIPTNISEMRQDKKIERGTFINHDTGLEIIFGKRSVEEITAKAIQDNKRGIPTDARLSALYQIKELIENSVCFDSQLSDYDTETSKNKSPNTLFMHKLYGVLKHENEYYLANLTVEESYFTDKEDKFKDTSNRMYSFRDIKITPIEAHRIFSPAVNNKNVAEDTSTDVIGITIPQLYELVKTYDRNFFENPAAPGRPEREAEMQAQSEYKNAVEKYNEHNSQNIDISKALDLDNNTITFSVITIDDEEPFIVGSHIDVEDIPDLEEYQDYIYDTGKTITDVKVEYYQIGNGDNESYDAYDEERTFISEHLEAVLSYHGTDCLESEIFSVEAPNELLEEINEEKEISAEKREEFTRKNNTLNNFFNNNPLAVFREIVKSDGLEPTENITVDDTKEMFNSLKSVDISLMGYTYTLEFETHDDSLSVKDTASDRTADFVWGHARELMYLVANENNISRENLIHNEVMRGTGFQDGKFRVEDFYRTNPSAKDFADFLENEFGIGGHSGNGPVKFTNYDSKGIEIETTSGTEHFTWSEAAKAISDLIDSNEYITQKDIDDRNRNAQRNINSEEIYTKNKEPVQQNIMDIILDDIPSLMKSAVAWDELMEYDGIAEQFEHGKDPIEVVKSYISNNGSFSYSPDELNKLDKSLHCSWSAKDNGNNAVITVNVTNLDTYSKYESQFTMPWTEIADAFKTRIDQERNYNRLADREITVSSIAGTDKYRFVDIENNIDEVKSREELTALFSKMFNKSELKAIIRNYIDLAPIEENPERSNTIESNRENSNSPLGNTYEPKINDIISIDDTAYRISDITDNMIALTAMDSLFAMPEYKSMADFLSSGFTVIEESQTVQAESTLHHSDNVPDNRLPEEKNTENFVIDNDNIGVSGGAKARYADNAAAIKTLKAIEAEGRTATPEEQQILSKYTGWGAVPQTFDPNNDKWHTEYTELQALLTPDEYAAARKSTLNAHYTSPTVISAIYDGLRTLGFESGKILEPAMGIGNFFGAMPENMRESKLYGVELDSLTGRIAKQLYPDADIQIKGFEQTSFADNSFDAAIGNVPFGDYKLNDKKYNDSNFLIHDYFFAKALDKIHPGGIVAFVTSHGTLDKENPDVRKYIAERAELLGAVRLPNNAFKANAGTEVTSDIIFLRKRDRPIEINPDNVEWLKKTETPDGFSVNNYFVQHPEMVLGKIVEGNKMFGSTNDTSCVPIEGADLKQQLAEAMKNIHGEYKAAEIETAPINADEIDAPENSRKYAYYAVNGNLYYREAEDTMKKVTLPQDTLNRAIGMTELRDNVHELLNLQLNNADGSLDGEIASSRKKLNNAYDSFVAKYGNISDRKNAKAMQGDNGYNLVAALEVKNEKGQVTGKADIFEHNTVKPKIIAAHVESAEEALILSVSEKGRVDFDFMTEHSGIEKDKLISELHGQIFRLPQAEEKYVTADEYLSGNIRKKLIELNNAPEGMDVSENRKALEAAMPPRVEAKDISVKLGAHWIDPKYVKQFILEKLSPDYETRRDIDVQYSSIAGTWKIEGVKPRAKNNYAARHTYGTERKHAYEIIEGILNNSDLLVKDRMKDAAGNEMRDPGGNYILITNDEETKAVRHCANLIKSEFQDWIFKDPERREELVQKYNDTYNSIRHREYDGSHLNFAGMNTDITLKEHQKNAVARALYGGNTLLAHAVGAGKSYEMIAIAMEGKRLGLHNKSLFAVPNSLTEQMGNDFRKLYPNANILVATKKDFERPNRLKLLAKIASNDWDAVIVGHSQFDRMGLSPEREKKYLTSEINKLREELEKAAADNIGKGKSFTVKAIEKSLAKYEDKLEKLNDGQVKDDFIDFEQLGFDKLFIDESHTYKNLATPTKMHNVSGLGSQGSARAFGLLMKGKYLDELTGSKGLVFASGTPVSNSMTELYTLMRYLQADMLKDCNINHFDEWAADFGEIKTDYELKPESDGKYQLKTRFAKFTNLPELMGMFKECADIRTADTLNLDKPKATVSEVVATPSKIQKKAIKALGKRAAQIRSGNVDPTKDNMLCITNDGRKIGLDQRLLNPNLPDDPNSKVNLCVKNVLDIYNKTADKRSTQCIFCDMSTPKSETRQDRFLIYRPDASKALGYDVIRKKTGIKAETGFDDIKKHIDKSATEAADKLQNGDIAVIRRPSEDMSQIISEAAVYENGKFNPVNSADLLERLEMSPVEDMPPKEFNIYDDIKDKLMKQGVPEKEIAFIHDYDTAEQKQNLFNKMNAGEVRVLLGSTSKCGAGMNTQKKMIALHHLDAPMRPSDMEQRNGRIERQGNENPEVQIFRYVTDKTFDSYLYQMLENKQKFISQVMTSKTPERTCSDIDEAALDYAEVKALCAGNPLIKEEMQLQNEIKDLKTEKARYSENIFDLQDKIRVKIPAAIQQTEAHIESCKKDFSLANSQPKVTAEDGREIYPIKIGDTVYNDRTAGGDALKAAIGGNIGKLAEGKTVPVGEYRGMQLSLLFDTMTKTTKACLAGEKHHYCNLNPETNTGNIIRLDNLINNMEKDIKQSQETLETMHSELAQMKIDVEKPFPKADELLRAETRLEEVHDQLTKLELTDDTANKDIFERFCTMFPEIINGEKEAVKYEAGEAFDPLSVELHGNVFSMAHTYTQNGDLMYDPLVYFKLDFANEKAIPISFENSGMGVYQEFDIDAEPTAESVHMANDVLDFVDTWLDNIDEQGYLDSEPQEKTKETNLSVGTGR